MHVKELLMRFQRLASRSTYLDQTPELAHLHHCSTTTSNPSPSMSRWHRARKWLVSPYTPREKWRINYSNNTAKLFVSLVLPYLLSHSKVPHKWKHEVSEKTRGVKGLDCLQVTFLSGEVPPTHGWRVIRLCNVTMVPLV